MPGGEFCWGNYNISARKDNCTTKIVHMENCAGNAIAGTVFQRLSRNSFCWEPWNVTGSSPSKDVSVRALRVRSGQTKDFS